MSFSRHPLPPVAASKPLDLEMTIVSAKHLKNVNWRTGDLKPYVIFWIDPDHRLVTKSDDSGSTRPVWNERFLLPITSPLSDAVLSLEVFHSKPSETDKPLVGSLRVQLGALPDPDDSIRIRSFELLRPSGRPDGKIRLKLALKDRPIPPPHPPPPPPLPSVPDYHSAPPSSYFYSPASHTPPPPPPHVRDFGGFPPPPYTSSLPSPSSSPSPSAYPYSYPDPYMGYYHSGYYSALTPLTTLPRPFFDRSQSYGGGSGPSAPGSYEQKPRGGRGKVGGAAAAGLGVGLAAGALGGMALDEGLKVEEEKLAERLETFSVSRDDYNEHRAEYY